MKCCEYGPIFPTLHFLRNLWLDAVSWSIKLHEAGKACQGQIIQLIVSIHNLQGVVSTTPVVCTIDIVTIVNYVARGKINDRYIVSILLKTKIIISTPRGVIYDRKRYAANQDISAVKCCCNVPIVRTSFWTLNTVMLIACLCLSLCLSVCLSVWWRACHLYVCLSTCLNVCLAPVCLLCLPACFPVCLLVACLSVTLNFLPSVRLSVLKLACLGPVS